jgi:uncharacterized membrane protein YfcA
MTGVLVTDPLFWFLAILGLGIVGISKGGFGGGLGVVGVPLISVAIPVQQAAAIMLPCLILMDFTGLHGWRGRWSVPHLQQLIPAALIGIVIGALSFHWMNDDMLRILIGSIGVAFGLHWWLKHFGWLPDPKQSTPGPIRTGLWSMVAGFTSFGVHAGGPPLQVALLPHRLAPTAYAATTVVFFAAVNLAKVGPYYWLDQFSPDVLMTALMLAPVGPLAVRLGIFLNQRISVTWFYRACYVGLVLTSLRLLSVGLTNQL